MDMLKEWMSTHSTKEITGNEGKWKTQEQITHMMNRQNYESCRHDRGKQAQMETSMQKSTHKYGNNIRKRGSVMEKLWH